MRAKRINLPAKLKKKLEVATREYGSTKAIAQDTDISYHVINQIRYFGIATKEQIDVLERFLR